MYAGVAGMGEYFAPVTGLGGLGDWGSWGWGSRAPVRRPPTMASPPRTGPAPAPLVPTMAVRNWCHSQENPLLMDCFAKRNAAVAAAGGYGAALASGAVARINAKYGDCSNRAVLLCESQRAASPTWGSNWGTRGLGEYFAAQGLGEIDPAMYTPLWWAGVRDMFKSKDSIATECSQMKTATPDEMVTCAAGRDFAAASSRTAIALGLALGAAGAWFALRRK